MRDISIGRFYDVESPIHALDPRLKLLLSFVYIGFIFYFTSIASIALICLFLGITIALSKVPFKYIARGIRPVVYIIVFTVIINLFMTGGTEIFRFYFLRVTVEGLIRSFFMGLRLILLIVGASLLTYTTSPIMLTDAIEQLLKPLSKIKVPAHEIAMMMSIALRFIPTLVEESDKLIKAQMARGANFDSRNILKRAKMFMPLIIPLFVNSLKRADDLAIAMEARCYRGGEGRTRYKTLKYRKRDFYALLIFILAMASVLAFDLLLGPYLMV